MSDAHLISVVEPIVVEVPMSAPTHGVHGTVSVQRSALVRVVSDQGAEGWGNVDPTPGYPIPRDQIAGLAEIRRGIGIPLMADESVTDGASLIDIIRRGAADLVKVKVMKQGGFLRTRAMIECAAAAGLRVVVGHGFGLTPSTLAEGAVAAVSEAVIDGCEAVGPLKMAADVVTEPARLDDGVLRLSDRPGLGVTMDLEAIARYRVIA